MRRFNFRLQRVLDLAVRKEKALEQELAAALALEKDAELLLDSAIQGFEKAGALLIERRKEGLKPWDWAVHDRYLKVLAMRRDEAACILAEARQKAAEARSALVEQRKERKALETLRTRELASYTASMWAEEAQALDEAAAIGFVRQAGYAADEKRCVVG